MDRKRIVVQQFWPVMDVAVKPGRAGSTRATNIFFSFPLISWKMCLCNNIWLGAEASFERYLLPPPSSLGDETVEDSDNGSPRRPPRRESVQVTRSQLISGSTDTDKDARFRALLYSLRVLLVIRFAYTFSRVYTCTRIHTPFRSFARCRLRVTRHEISVPFFSRMRIERCSRIIVDFGRVSSAKSWSCASTFLERVFNFLFSLLPMVERTVEMTVETPRFSRSIPLERRTHVAVRMHAAVTSMHF